MVSQARARKIGNRIQEILAEILRREVADPRLEGVTVTGVDVDRELAFATVWVTGLGESLNEDEVLRALIGARGFLRSELASRIPLRSFPRLRFRWDASSDRGARIEELLRQLERGEPEDREEDH